MADFVAKSTVKSAERVLATPFASKTALNTIITTILANEALRTAMGGTASHDSSEDGFSVTLKCHAASGELYNVAFKRDKVTVSSFEADSILSTIETWADTIPALA
ncbi:MAG TPA: hypothetical protein PLY78_10480 [Methanospirillum sp.]|nr:hypothetical protein [Methanospirillum sp.]